MHRFITIIPLTAWVYAALLLVAWGIFGMWGMVIAALVMAFILG